MAKRNMSIELDMDNHKWTKKLRAISKHTEALADELEAIDKEDKGVWVSEEDIQKYGIDAAVNRKLLGK